MDWCEIFSYTQLITIVLLIVSETLGISKCEYNGIIDLFLKIYNHVSCRRLDNDVTVTPY